MRRRKRSGKVTRPAHDPGKQKSTGGDLATTVKKQRRKHPGNSPGPVHNPGKQVTTGGDPAKTGGSTICPKCSSLDLVVEDQQQTQWCWAAVAQAIDHFYHLGSTLTQCQIASTQQGSDCCSDPVGCNCPGELEKALCVVKCLDQGPIHSTLPFNDLRDRIKATDPKPVCARIGYEDGGGHFVVIKGVLEEAQMLLIADPSDGDRLVRFSEFLENYQGFGGWSDYYLTDKVNHGNCI